MLRLRRSQERGWADHGWLKAFHSFSFADYFDPDHMGFGSLRVINEDRIAPGKGFGTHGHRDMEIITYVLAGELAHRDTLGNVKTIPAGEMQRMSAGRGVQHSEFNHAQDQETHLLQIWIEPNERGIEPSYEQKAFSPAAKRGRLCMLASPDGRDGSVHVHADALLLGGLFDGHEQAAYEPAPSRKLYVHLACGTLQVNGQPLAAGDAALLEDEARVVLSHGHQADVLLFDLAGR